MAADFRDLFNKALRSEREILRPYFFKDEYADPKQLVTEETYLRLRLTRMFLQHQRVLFQTKYPVVHALMRFSGLNGMVEANFIARPEISEDGSEKDLDQVVTLDQTLMGPILYRGGDLDLLIGLYAAPADDWAKRFISLAEGVSQLTLNVGLATAISMASTVKKAVESSMGSDGLSLKLGLSKELKENEWLSPGYIVMIAAPEGEIDYSALTVEDGELLTKQGRVYSQHDYIVLAVEVTNSRSDWQSLGYGSLWQNLLQVAAEVDDVQRVKDTYVTFSGAVMASQDLSWSDRSAIVALAQQRVKEIRDKRVDTDFLAGLKGVALEEESLLFVDVDALETISGYEDMTAVDLMGTDWLG